MGNRLHNEMWARPGLVVRGRIGDRHALPDDLDSSHGSFLIGPRVRARHDGMARGSKVANPSEQAPEPASPLLELLDSAAQLPDLALAGGVRLEGFEQGRRAQHYVGPDLAPAGLDPRSGELAVELRIDRADREPGHQHPHRQHPRVQLLAAAAGRS